ncbi:hypothetical protein Q1695_006563 [Nippostrongylus brasiliensis]|nr:hypothetical protein Q1695_006563 [Nippostrongylus brasiliensis]
MSDIVAQNMVRGPSQIVVKQEKPTYRSPALTRRHTVQHVVKPKYSEVRVASSCFRPSGLLASDLPVDNKHFVDKSMGLRHFSTKVCEKVKEKGRTNYNQVADELVAEYFAANNMNSEEFLERQKFDQKNIRRRVYDALNVLLAMNIICKRKKDIDWVGLPATKAGEIKRLEEEKAKLTERIRRKKESIHELVVQLVAYKSLVWKNREMERISGRPSENTLLYLPFVIINTSKNTTVDCAVSGDRSEFLFNFDQSFEVHDDFEALKRLGFSYGLEHNYLNPEMMEHIDEFLPPALRGYITKILNGELTDSESRVNQQVKSSQPVQYLIRDAPDRKMQATGVDHSGSDHSSEGSYTDLAPSVFSSADNYSYSVPAYDSEIVGDIEVLEGSTDYAGYSLDAPSTSYEPMEHCSRTAAVRHNPNIHRNTAELPVYSAAGPSTSKIQHGVQRVITTKRPVYTMPSGQVYRKSHGEMEGGFIYNVHTKRAKAEDSAYEM